ncbi:MAG TPA: aldo/keto reductase [Bryobacteraceae bacterium]|jgi:aryl-alcohol dehydrogenase-like predicted oxidoreductase|nr:aldo/keto reductase [Bryobacteraceae bacterium]
MKFRPLGRTGFDVSEVSLGAWQIGGAWGSVPDEDALRVVRAALDSGINFIDTADVYGDGRSERFIAQVLRDHPGRVFVATKAGRRLSPHTAHGYNRENLTEFIERSLRNLERDALDLVQLHCPPTEVYYLPEVFGILADLKQDGKILHYGVSVEKVEEALIAIEYPDVQTVQIIFNPFRQRPREILFPLCRERRVGVLARLPLSSGLLSGKIRRDSQFAADDHRNFNRNGERFDKGETFSGIPLEVGLDAVEEIRKWAPEGVTMANFTLRWILDEPAVSCVIPGARNEQQVRQNAAASDLAPLTKAQRDAVNSIYERRVKMLVHHRW